MHGHVETAGGVSGNMAHHNSFRGRMRCVNGPQPKGERLMWAETFYKPVEYRANETLLEITIYTGVTHQIRCQLASIGYPIVGDKKYRCKTNPIKRLCLHANMLEFIHPVSKKIITIKCDIPDEFNRIMK